MTLYVCSSQSCAIVRTVHVHIPSNHPSIIVYNMVFVFLVQSDDMIL